MSTKLPTLLNTLRKIVGTLPGNHESGDGAELDPPIPCISGLSKCCNPYREPASALGDYAGYLSSGVLYSMPRFVVPSPQPVCGEGFNLLRRTPGLMNTPIITGIRPVDQVIHHVLCAEIAVFVFEACPS